MRDLTGVILAGGRSRRFGSDKASAMLLDRPMLQWVADALIESCERVLIVAAPGQQLPAITADVAIEVMRDDVGGRGPVAGLLTAFRALGKGLCFAAACDLPLLHPRLPPLLAALGAGHDAVVPDAAGGLQPLAAIYRPGACRAGFERALARGDGSLHGALQGLRVRVVPEADLLGIDPSLDSFRNANDAAGLEAIGQAARLRGFGRRP